MFCYSNSLGVYNEENYPYSMEYVPESMYSHRHSVCSGEGFVITAGGCKHLLNMPDLKTFEMSVTVDLEKSSDSLAEADFGILFGYQPEKRTGDKLGIVYSAGTKQLKLGIYRVCGAKEICQEEQGFADVVWADEKNITLRVWVKEDSCGIFLDDLGCEFSCEAKAGRVGITATSVFFGVGFQNLQLSSQDEIPVKSHTKRHMDIPLTYGGLIPYGLDLEIETYENGTSRIRYALTDGIHSREKLEWYADIWVFFYEDITNPYILFVNGDKREKYYLFNGILRFSDANCPESGKRIWKRLYTLADTPYEGTVFVNGDWERGVLGYGFEEFDAWGYDAMRGAGEFLYDVSGKLLYSGTPLEKDVVSRLCSPGKQILNRIPQGIEDYEKAIAHAKGNHYFCVGEIPKFSLEIHTCVNTYFLSAKIVLQDAFFDEIQEITQMQWERKGALLCGYETLEVSFEVPALEIGVYHAAVEILYGDRVIHTHCSAFEVLDPEQNISPVQKSGLPTLYVGDGAPPRSESNIPDFYTPKEDFNWNHYFQIDLLLPIDIEKKRPWELLHFYKRELFTWITKRSVMGYDLKKIQETVKNSDYINYLYPKIEDCPCYYRFDFYLSWLYQSKYIIGLVNEFLQQHSGHRECLGWEGEILSMDETMVMHLLQKCGQDWIPFGLSRVREEFRLQEQELRKVNPGFRRNSYGPYAQYQAPYLSGYATKWFGFEPTTLHEIFDGICQFEDYPFSCVYPSNKGAWGVMTIKLLDPLVRIFPELYMSYPEGCPDGAVAYAYPPSGGSDCPLYFIVTQTCEYVYNTPFYKNGRFQYWRDDGFSLFEFIDDPSLRTHYLLSLWGKVRKYRPAKPVGGTAFLYELHSGEDRYDYEKIYNAFYNISEANLAYVHEIIRTGGLGSGYAVTKEDLCSLTEQDMNCLVLPDLTGASKELLDRIRELHSKGVVLVAVSKVPGLEDLFKAEVMPRKEKISQLSYRPDASSDAETETVDETTADLNYRGAGANVVLYGSGQEEILMTADRAILLNVPVSQVGIDSFYRLAYLGRHNISRLLKKALTDCLDAQVTCKVRGSAQLGVTLCETESGEEVLLLVDYSEYCPDRLEQTKRREVYFRTDEFRDAEYLEVYERDTQIHKMHQGESLKMLSVEMYPQEAILLRLILNEC